MINPLEEYIEKLSSKPSPVLQELYRETWLKTIYPRMASGAVQGKLLAFFCQMIQAKHVLEIGTFTGYATISMAEVLPEDGKIITIEANEELEALIRKYLYKAGVETKVQLLIGDAKVLLPNLEGPFDLIFLDADKAGYPMYYELSKKLLRKGGLLLADNVLWGGKVVDQNCHDHETNAIRKFNQLVSADAAVEQLIVPLRDGLNIIRKL